MSHLICKIIKAVMVKAAAENIKSSVAADGKKLRIIKRELMGGIAFNSTVQSFVWEEPFNKKS